jgi:NifU-like protein involved in Fe-S cluster formation
VKNELLQQVGLVIQAKFRSAGQQIGPTSAGALAAACVGVAIEIALHAADAHYSMDDASELSTVFIESAFRNLDVAAIASIDDRLRPRS